MSLPGSADDVRFRFLKGFQDDFRDRNGLGGFSGACVGMLLRVSGSLGSCGSRTSLGSLRSLSLDGESLETTISGSECAPTSFCCRRYNSLRIVTARSLASIAESMHASKSVTLSSLLAWVRWRRKLAWTSMVRPCRARCATSSSNQTGLPP